MILDLFVSIPLYHTFFCPSNLGRRQQYILNENKECIAQSDDLCFLIDSTGLKKGYDMAHYDTPSNIELGRRFAKEFLENYEKSN